MDESGNRYILGKPARAQPAPQTSAKALNEEELHKKRMQIIELFGTVDFHPGYDYKEGRRRRSLKITEAFGEIECDPDYDYEARRKKK